MSKPARPVKRILSRPPFRCLGVRRASGSPAPAASRAKESIRSPDRRQCPCRGVECLSGCRPLVSVGAAALPAFPLRPEPEGPKLLVEAGRLHQRLDLRAALARAETHLPL